MNEIHSRRESVRLPVSGFRSLATLVLIMSASLARASETPFAPVEKNVDRRTGHSVSWEKDLAAREESLAQARTLLRKPLTTASAVQIALLNNRDLQASFDEIGLTFADLREARMLANPEANLAVSVPAGTIFEWSVAQNFLSLLMIPMRARVAREHLAGTQLRVSDSVVKLVAEVKSAVTELQAGEALLERLSAAHDTQNASLQLTQAIHAAGNTPDLKLVEEQAAYSQSRLDVAMAEATQRESREKLNRLLGLWGSDTNWKLAGALPDVPSKAPSIHGLETLAVANRLDLAAARADLTSLVKALGLEKSFRFIGVLDFGIASSHDADSPASTGPSVRLELPLFNHGQSRIARGEAQLRLAQSRFEQLAVGIRSDVRELRDRMLSKRDMALFYRDDLLPTRRRILSLTLLNYNAMLSGAFDLFTAKREELEAEKGWIAARRDYWIARAELERAVGGDLDAPPDPTSPAPSPAPSKSKISHHR